MRCARSSAATRWPKCAATTRLMSMSSTLFRDLFPVTKSLIYFNHAALGPLSVRAAESMEEFVRDQRDYGALHWKKWYAEDDRFRESAAKLINADADEIA